MIALGGLDSHFGRLVIVAEGVLGWPGYIGVDKAGR